MKKFLLVSLFSALCLSSYSCSFSQSAIHIDRSQMEKQLSQGPGGYGYVAARLVGVNLAAVHPTELAAAATELAHVWKGNAQLIQIACRAPSNGILNLETRTDTDLHYYFSTPLGTGTGDATVANNGGQLIMRLSTFDSGINNDSNVPLPLDHLVDLSSAMQKAVPDIGGADRPDIMCRYKTFPAKNGQPQHLAWQLQNWNTQKERFVDATSSGTLTSHATGMSAWQKLLAGEDGDAWYFHPHMDYPPKTFPAPTYPGSKAIGVEHENYSYTANFVQHPLTNSTLHLVSPDDCKIIRDWYWNFYQSHGWKLYDMTPRRNPQGAKDWRFQAENATSKVIVSIGQETELSEISLEYDPKPQM